MPARHRGPRIPFRLFTARVRITSPASAGRNDYVTHPAGQHLKVCRAVIVPPTPPQHVTVFMAVDGSPASIGIDSLEAVMEQEPSGTIGVLVGATAPGQATAVVKRADEGRASAVASAIAVMQASWGWDESRQIVVRVNATWVTVAPEYTGDEWTVQGFEEPDLPDLCG
jgi:hypothetical protein